MCEDPIIQAPPYMIEGRSQYFQDSEEAHITGAHV